MQYNRISKEVLESLIENEFNPYGDLETGFGKRVVNFLQKLRVLVVDNGVDLSTVVEKVEGCGVRLMFNYPPNTGLEMPNGDGTIHEFNELPKSVVTQLNFALNDNQVVTTK